MTRKLVIQGDHVALMEESVVSECTLKDFMGEYLKDLPVCTGLLPSGLVFYASTRKTKWHIFELTPRVIDINYSGHGQGPSSVHTISLPFMFMSVVMVDNMIQEGGVRICCTHKRLESLDDQIYRIPLPNIYDSGQGYVCLGSMTIDPNTPDIQKARAVFDTFFLSNFNDDLSIGWPEEFTTIAGWEALTRKNSMVGLTLKYQPYFSTDNTIRNFINTDLRRYDGGEQFTL